MAQPTTIIPIAGGKGGVGKTFITAALAIALARRGHSTIAVDLDLGNSNLHNFLGLENRFAGIGEYLRGSGKKRMHELLVPTGTPQLRFLPGDARMPFMANVTYNQKRVLLRELRQLPARYVLLDLSAGTSFNTLDLFSISDYGILVTTPEHPAIVGMLVFLKNLVLRAIDQQLRLRKDPSLVDVLNEMSTQRIEDSIFTVDAFRSRLKNLNPDAHADVESLCRRLRPRFVYNMVSSFAETGIFTRIERTLAEIMGLQCDHIGLVPSDEVVRQTLRQPGGLLFQDASSITGHAIDRLALRIIKYWDQPIDGSAELLRSYARTIFPDQGEAGK